jgi:hypothetical protein
MPIPYDDGDDFSGGLGSVAFLKLIVAPDGDCSIGALLIINARGEPLEFAYNRVRVPQGFLWRKADLREHVQRRLTASLLSVCTQQPLLLVCLDEEIGIRLFGQNLRIEIPVARVAPGKRTVDTTTGEVVEDDASSPPHVAWQPSPPEAGSVERKLFEYLSAHGLLLEPFERAAVGLREVYGPEL